ncbi:MAG TPA: hypothetical protein VF401_02285 [Candidatus Saccharimonadales bacterium]
MNKNVKSLIGWWKVLGRDQSDPFMKFFVFYMCLDAWMTAESGKDRDEDKLNWLINTPNDLNHHRQGIQGGAKFQSWLNGLMRESPVDDMRPSKLGVRTVSLSDTSDFSQVVKFIYQIRCNLFHGSKSPLNARDKHLVNLSGKILERWIEWTSAKIE